MTEMSSHNLINETTCPTYTRNPYFHQIDQALQQRRARAELPYQEIEANSNQRIIIPNYDGQGNDVEMTVQQIFNSESILTPQQPVFIQVNLQDLQEQMRARILEFMQQQQQIEEEQQQIEEESEDNEPTHEELEQMYNNLPIQQQRISDFLFQASQACDSNLVTFIGELQQLVITTPTDQTRDMLLNQRSNDNQILREIVDRCLDILHSPDINEDNLVL